MRPANEAVPQSNPQQPMLSGEVGPQCEVIQRLYSELNKAAGSLDPSSPSEKEVADLLQAAISLMQAANQLTARANAYS